MIRYIENDGTWHYHGLYYNSVQLASPLMKCRTTLLVRIGHRLSLMLYFLYVTPKILISASFFIEVTNSVEQSFLGC
jgi:hypothetical protein